MQTIMLIGIIIAVIGIILIGATTSYNPFAWFNPYGTTNTGLSLLGWVLLVIGLGIVAWSAYANGQFHQ